jgi:hypothetical protein
MSDIPGHRPSDEAAILRSSSGTASRGRQTGLPPGATAIIWRLLPVAEKRFRTLNAPEQCRGVYRGVRCDDGIEVPVASCTEQATA